MKERIQLLSQEVLKHKRLYYKGQKEIEDEEYDILEEELRKLDPKNPVLSMVGSDFFSGEKIKHDKKMLSLNKKYDINELIDWVEDQKLLGMFKVDGSASSIMYEKGKLKLAKTRGNGEYGENITAGVLYIPSIKKKLSKNIDAEIRGEIYCKHDRFEFLCQEMERRGLDTPKSPRNVVAGILGRKDHVDLAEYLDFLSFDFICDEHFDYENEKIDLLKENKFETPKIKKITNTYELNEYIEEVKNFFDNGNYLIDGAVFVYDDIRVQEEKGYTSHHPKYKMAFKFQSEGTETTLTDIEWQISRFGVYTPVGVVSPVELDGATITKVTLHNLKTVKLFNLKKEDTIKIVRSGEVIPKFLEVVEESDNELEIPKKCFYCDNDLIEEEVRLICDNTNCNGRHKEYILNFIKKIGIDDLSEKRLEPMMEMGMVSTVEDIYKLTKEDLLKLPQTKARLADKILKNINKSKKINIIKFLSSLNFVGGARKNTELLIEEGYDSFDKIFNLSVDDLLKIKGFAEKKANDYIRSLHDNRDLIFNLIELGFEIEWPKVNKGGVLEGKQFCITGDLNIAENRKQLEKIIKENGGKASSSVSKNTDYLICNEESSSSKYKKAQSLNIPIITEKEFENLFVKIN